MEGSGLFSQPDLRAFQTTGDGSQTLFSSRFQETYHSRHGARTESEHVFIRHGLDLALQVFPGPIRIFEVGFGTGLNAYLAAIEAEKKERAISYLGYEAFPLSAEQRSDWLTFPWENSEIARQVGLTPANTGVSIGNHFYFEWRMLDWPSAAPSEPSAELIFYDAFAPGSQPELWTLECFQKAIQMLVPGGILVTYCAKGDVKRNMKAAGFEVERLPGPPGKREITRARKSG